MRDPYYKDLDIEGAFQILIFFYLHEYKLPDAWVTDKDLHQWKAPVPSTHKVKQIHKFKKKNLTPTDSNQTLKKSFWFMHEGSIL